ncbi:hypothetical protein CBS101457_003928 [Exobasidium rhododendri]|nr:hypothetical protein CBS101457_003928 [Exobasidium rhododendri]
MSFSQVPAVRPAIALLQEIRSSCNAVRRANGIELDDKAIDDFILHTLPADLTTNSKKWLESGYKLPLAYPSLHAELNVICHLCFLNSLSGYREAFHQNTGQGAHKNIVQIVLSCYLSDPAGDSNAPLSANTLVALNPMALLDILRLETHVESKHPLIPATILGKRRRDDLYEALEVLCIAANDTGKRLNEMNCPDLGSFVERSLKEANTEGKTEEEKAALFATKLITALPAFNDSYKFTDGSTVHIHKRALLLLSWLRAAFHATANAPPIPSPDVLPAFIDNVIPSLLVFWGIIDLNNAKDDTLRQWARTGRQVVENESLQSDGKAIVIPGPTLSHEQAYIIRAAALDACRAIKDRCVQLAREGRASSLSTINEALIDGFIWTQAKVPSLRNIPRLVEKKTFQY